MERRYLIEIFLIYFAWKFIYIHCMFISFNFIYPCNILVRLFSVIINLLKSYIPTAQHQTEGSVHKWINEQIVVICIWWLPLSQLLFSFFIIFPRLNTYSPTQAGTVLPSGCKLPLVNLSSETQTTDSLHEHDARLLSLNIRNVITPTMESKYTKLEYENIKNFEISWAQAKHFCQIWPPSHLMYVNPNI